MNLDKLLLSTICLLCYAVSHSQTDTKKNKIHISTGYNFGALKNLEIAPISRYDYNGLVYKLNYARETKNQHLFELDLAYLSSELKTEIIPILNLDYNKITFGLSSLKKAYVKNNVSLYLGLHSQSNVSLYSKNNNFRSILDQRFGVASQFSYQINQKSKLSSKLIIPMVLLRTTHASSGINSLKSYQSILWSLEYKYTLSNRFGAVLSYDFNYDRLQIPNTFRELQYQLNLGFNFKF